MNSSPWGSPRPPSVPLLFVPQDWLGSPGVAIASYRCDGYQLNVCPAPSPDIMLLPHYYYPTTLLLSSPDIISRNHSQIVSCFGTPSVGNKMPTRTQEKQTKRQKANAHSGLKKNCRPLPPTHPFSFKVTCFLTYRLKL